MELVHRVLLRVNWDEPWQTIPGRCQYVHSGNYTAAVAAEVETEGLLGVAGKRWNKRVERKRGCWCEEDYLR
jgi:hypothetical protein